MVRNEDMCCHSTFHTAAVVWEHRAGIMMSTLSEPVQFSVQVVNQPLLRLWR